MCWIMLIHKTIDSEHTTPETWLTSGKNKRVHGTTTDLPDVQPEAPDDEDEEGKDSYWLTLRPASNKCRADDTVRCRDDSRYICSVQQCDGVPDCDDGGDEVNCPHPGISRADGSIWNIWLISEEIDDLEGLRNVPRDSISFSKNYVNFIYYEKFQLQEKVNYERDSRLYKKKEQNNGCDPSS